MLNLGLPCHTTHPSESEREPLSLILKLNLKEQINFSSFFFFFFEFAKLFFLNLVKVYPNFPYINFQSLRKMQHELNSPTYSAHHICINSLNHKHIQNLRIFLFENFQDMIYLWKDKDSRSLEMVK